MEKRSYIREYPKHIEPRIYNGWGSNPALISTHRKDIIDFFQKLEEHRVEEDPYLRDIVNLHYPNMIRTNDFPSHLILEILSTKGAPRWGDM